MDRLHAIAGLVLRDPDLAEDAQEALVRSWRHLPKLRDVERFDAWLYRILMRAAADEFGRRRRFEGRVHSVRRDETVMDGTRELMDRDELERGFRRLSVEHRAVVVLHHYDGLPLPEVAMALGIPAGTAKSPYDSGPPQRLRLAPSPRSLLRSSLPRWGAQPRSSTHDVVAPAELLGASSKRGLRLRLGLDPRPRRR